MSSDILPGDKEDKLANCMQPIFDNLTYLLTAPAKRKSDNNEGDQTVKQKVEKLMHDNVIELEALTYIRGRAIPRQYVIIDAPELSRKIHIDHGISGSRGMDVWVAVRPEKIVISEAPPAGDYNWARGVVDEIAYIGGLSIYHVKTPGGTTIRATLANVDRSVKKRLTWDDKVYLSWQPGAAVVLTW